MQQGQDWGVRLQETQNLGSSTARASFGRTFFQMPRTTTVAPSRHETRTKFACATSLRSNTFRFTTTLASSRRLVGAERDLAALSRFRNSV